MSKKPHFRATLTYLPTKEGGIVTPVSSGFRAVVRFVYGNQEYFANQEFLDTELVFPGDIATAEVTLIAATDILDKIFAGMDFDLLINSNIIGSGIVTIVYSQ